MISDNRNNQYWEQGSDFHLLDFAAESNTMYPWDDTGMCMGSGRDAIRILLEFGAQNRGWSRLWLPGYFCQEVAESILASGITVLVYNIDPFEYDYNWAKLPLQKGDVILTINYFGLAGQMDYTGIDRSCVVIIEDHSHDPYSHWAWNSKADWCIASLRKTMPIPDGGVLWSPLNLNMPKQVSLTLERKNASSEKFIAMVLKKYYLEGKLVRKDVFREFTLSGEAGIASGEISAMSPWSKEMLSTFPIDNWRKIRVQNYICLADIVRTCNFMTVPELDMGEKCPLSLPILFDKPARRDYIRKLLIENSVYPAILWDLDDPVVNGVSNELVDLSERILLIHCDMRYSVQDIELVGKMIINYAHNYNQIK